MEFVLHPEEFLPLAFEHTVYRDARPPCHNLGDVRRRHCLIKDMILDGILPGFQFADPLLEVSHLSVADFSNLSVVTGPFRSGGLNLKIFNLSPAGLDFVEYALFGIPPLLKLSVLLAGLGEFGLNLVELKGYALVFYGFLLDFQLFDFAVQLGNRLRHGVHLKTKLCGSLIHEVNGLVREKP